MRTRADAESGQFNSSGNAGASGSPGEMYNASAMKNEPVSLDAVMDKLNSMHKRLDEYEAEDKKNKAEGLRGLDNEHCDEDENEDDPRKGENEIPTKGEPKKLAADTQDKNMVSRMDSAHDRATAMKVNAQARADSVLSLKNESAPRSLDGESPMTYRKRLPSSLLRYSQTWRNLNLSTITDSSVLSGIEQTVYADSVAALRDPAQWGSPDGELVERVELDESGRKIKSFYSSIGPRSWMSAFSGSPARRVAGIRTRSSD